MGLLGKVLTGAAIGVGAIALAPFTGGGSLAAGASLGASLAGAGTVAAAAGAGVAGAVAGAVSQEMEDDAKYEEIKKAKKASFEDGIKEGVTLTVEELKKRDDYMLAVTAFVYYVARVDGSISEEEEAELNEDLVFIKENSDLSDALIDKLDRISKDKYIGFEDVKFYLDNVSVENLGSFRKNLREIIEADGVIHEEELEAQKLFKNYYEGRKNE